MWKFSLVPLLLLVTACKKDPPPAPPAPALKPQEVNVEGALHAVACGGVTAVWSGNAENLKDLPQPAPKSFAVESLAFKFADGTSKGFTPTGQLFFSDWRFDVFAPDCSAVALLTDHYGPYEVVKLTDLRAYLEHRAEPLKVQAPSTGTGLVHSDLAWRDAQRIEFISSCCGGAQVFAAKVAGGPVERVFEAPSAPKGLRRVRDGYEVVP
jgi:hypothetical protein